MNFPRIRDISLWKSLQFHHIWSRGFSSVFNTSSALKQASQEDWTEDGEWVTSGEKCARFSWLCQGWTRVARTPALQCVNKVVSFGTFTPDQCHSCHLPFPSSSYCLFLKTGRTQQVSGPQKLGAKWGLQVLLCLSLPMPRGPFSSAVSLSLIVFQIMAVLSYFRSSFPLAFLTFECLFLLQSPPRAVFSDQPPWRSASTCFFFILPPTQMASSISL